MHPQASERSIAMTNRSFVFAALFALAGPPAQALDCSGGLLADRIVAIPARGEALLESGSVVRLAGVRLADAGGTGAAARAALDEAVGQPVAVVLLAPTPDRWGRRPARILVDEPDERAAEGAPPVDLATRLVSDGLAVVDPGTDATLCDRALLDHEEAARRAGRGLWAEPDERPLSATALDALGAREGRFTLVEGVVARVGARDRRTYLDFGRSWPAGFTVIVPGPVRDALAARGLDAAALEGRRIRVRGIVETGRGPALTVTSVDSIEVFQGTSAEPVRQRP